LTDQRLSGRKGLPPQDPSVAPSDVRLGGPEAEGPGFHEIVGRSEALRRALDLALKAARSDASILVMGESGTGKEMVAREIHAHSRRAAEPFVAVDCASIPATLLESELFGYEAGAFTGAGKTKPGLLEVADRGTLFFDEVAELPLDLQPKLLRVLQERHYRRVGGTVLVAFDARVVAATNRDLGAMVRRREFRQDLFYRLHVIPVRLPALRDRPGDVALLAEFFLRKLTKSAKRPVGFAPEVIKSLEAYHWPGNVRELQNAIEHACALAEGDAIALTDLPQGLAEIPDAALREQSPAVPLEMSLRSWMDEHERSYLIQLLDAYPRNISRAARAAGVDRKTLRHLLAKHGLH
jgi:two-component system, NtrC family, response regulator HydG